MTFSRLSTGRLLTATGAVLVLAGCADVGGSKPPAPADPTAASTICQSIRTAMQADQKAADAAAAAGNTAEAARRRQAVVAGAQGARSVSGCDTSDIVPASAVPALPTGPTPGPTGS